MPFVREALRDSRFLLPLFRALGAPVGVENEDGLGMEIFVDRGEVLEHFQAHAQGPVGEVLHAAMSGVLWLAALTSA